MLFLYDSPNPLSQALYKKACVSAQSNAQGRLLLRVLETNLHENRAAPHPAEGQGRDGDSS